MRGGRTIAALLLTVAVFPPPSAAAIDRTRGRFHAPETGGVGRPQFVFERELSFEARLEALADPDRGERTAAYLDRHVRAAPQRPIAGELLAPLGREPEPGGRE